MFQGSGAVFKTLGFEYWANPSARDEGFITWQVNGSPTIRLGAPGHERLAGLTASDPRGAYGTQCLNGFTYGDF